MIDWQNFSYRASNPIVTFGEEADKFIAKATLATAATAGIVATGGTAAPLIGGLVAAEGYCIKKATENCNNKGARELGEIVGDSLIDGGVGTVLGEVIKIKK